MRLSHFLHAAGLLLAALVSPYNVVGAQSAKRTPGDSAAGKVYFAEVMLEGQRLRMPEDSAGRAKAFEESSRIARDGADAYRTLGADPSAVGLVLEQVLSGFYPVKGSARGAVQISQSADEQQIRLALLRAAQAARIIEQNDQIIQLLGQLVRKK